MEIFLQFLEDNLAIILSIPGIGAIGLFLINWFTKKVLPNWLNLLARLISNLFGVKFEDGRDLVEQLSFVTHFDESIEAFQDNILDYVGTELLKKKQQLGSTAYTELEKIPIQAAYDYLYNKYKDQLPEAIRDILDMSEPEE